MLSLNSITVGCTEVKVFDQSKMLAPVVLSIDLEPYHTLTYHSVQDIMNMILRLSMDFGLDNFYIIPPDKPGNESKDVLQRRQKAASIGIRTRTFKFPSGCSNH